MLLKALAVLGSFLQPLAAIALAVGRLTGGAVQNRLRETTKMLSKSGSATAAALFATLFALVGCAATKPTIPSGPDAQISFDGLHRVTGTGADETWILPDLDLSRFSGIKLEGAGIEYRPGGKSGRFARAGSGPYEVTEAQKKRLSDLMVQVFTDELGKSKRFHLVNEPGPDVLLIRGRLLDVVSYVPQETIGMSDIYLRSVGEATLVLEVRDSVTNAILARSIDRRAAEQPGQRLSESNPVTNAAEMRRVALQWARSLRRRLDEFGGNPATPASAPIDTSWQWVRTVTPIERIEVAEPERYTLLLKPDGRAEVGFDCNKGGGHYELAGNKLTFGPLISTRKACPADSQDAAYMSQLGRISSFFIQDGNLFLEMPMDSGTMRFEPASASTTAVH